MGINVAILTVVILYGYFAIAIIVHGVMFRTRYLHRVGVVSNSGSRVMTLEGLRLAHFVVAIGWPVALPASLLVGGVRKYLRR